MTELRGTMTILEALADPQLFGGLRTFRDLTTWRAWLVFLAAIYGLPFSDLEPVGVSEADAHALFTKHTERVYAPRPGGFKEAAAIVGRQAGKDRIAGVIQAYEAMTATASGDGDEIFALSICQDARASLRTQLRYARTPFERLPLLKPLVVANRTDNVELSTGITLAGYPCKPTSVRGLRARVVVASEVAFFRNTEGYAVDVEMLRAVRPTLATTGGRLVILSSPYAQTGALYDLHRRYYGVADAPVLVWQATAPEMNPTLPADYLTRMEADDPEAYRSEVLGEFRIGLSTLLDPLTLDDCLDHDVRERAARPGVTYLAHTDAASGTGRDAWALAIAHRDGETAVLDVLRVWKPPFNPSSVVADITALLRPYGLTEVCGDRYAPGFVSEAFQRERVRYVTSDRDTSTILLDLVPVVNAGGCRLLNDPDLLKELRALERRQSPGGRDRAGHRPGGHDDRAVAVAGAVTRARTPRISGAYTIPICGF